MQVLLAIFLGSGLGGVTRYLISKAISANNTYAFPLGTLVVNFMACFILGCILGLGDKVSANSRLLFATGFCGGFSTFSAFSGETLLLLQEGNYLQASLYILASVIVCIAATFFGYWIVKG